MIFTIINIAHDDIMHGGNKKGVDNYDLVYYSLIQSSIAREAMNMGLLSNNEKHEAGCYHCGLVALFVSFVILVIVGALASIPLLVYGIRGLLNLEECAIGALHSLDAFNLLTGLLFLLVFVAVVIFTSAFIYELCYGGKRKPTHHLITSLLILAMYFCVCDIAYSFYIASQVYGQYDEFQQGQANCSSPVYYSSFVSVVIVHLYVIVEIGLGFLLYWWWTLPTGK